MLPYSKVHCAALRVECPGPQQRYNQLFQFHAGKNKVSKVFHPDASISRFYNKHSLYLEVAKVIRMYLEYLSQTRLPKKSLQQVFRIL